MELILRALVLAGAIALVTSLLVATYSVYQYRRRSETADARNARLDHETKARVQAELASAQSEPSDKQDQRFAS